MYVNKLNIVAVIITFVLIDVGVKLCYYVLPSKNELNVNIPHLELANIKAPSENWQNMGNPLP